MQSQMQIPVEFLVRQLQHIPGLRISYEQVEVVLFEDWARKWLEKYKKGIVKDNTYRSTYLEPVELHLIPHFGGLDLCAISAEDVQDYFKGLASELSLETIKKIRNALRQIYEVAVENHLCFDSPVRSSLRLVSSIPPIEKKTWSADQYTTAFQFALNHHNGLEIITLMETAITRSELLGLSWQDLHVTEKMLSLKNGLVCQQSTCTGRYELVHDGLKNKYRHRCVPISPLLCGLLALKPRTIMVGGKKKRTELIFHSPNGSAYDPRNWYRRVLVKLMHELHEEHPEVPILTTHELRHTRATLLKDEGVDVFSIARLLGHVDLNMLAKRYAHDNVEALRKALAL